MSVDRPLYIISGGQTGVDRAALDAALELNIECAGWCPKGRLAEDGRIPERYPLREMESKLYDDRTYQNVADSDATLILWITTPDPGTETTRKFCKKLNKPFLVVDLQTHPSASAAREWLHKLQVSRLNVAGPRESNVPGIHHRSFNYLMELFRMVNGS